MQHKLKYSLYIFSALLIGLYSCKKWDDHTTLRNPNANETLFEQIAKRTDLGKFEEYLVKTGLDKELSSSKNFTVWAPTDKALSTLDPAVVADSARLRFFLSNHISTQAYYTSAIQNTVRIPLLNGKRINLTTNKFDEATITEANFTVKNGVLHVIDKAVPPLQNLWEFVNSTAAQFAQNAFILTQNFNGFDPATAIVDSISSTTGLPVYRPGTGLIPRNRFNDQVYDLKNEEKQYTYFLLNDAALKKEVDSLSAFYKTGTADSTYALSAMSVVRDAVVEGMYTMDQLPATLVSKFGVTIPVNKNAIVETRRVSNGIVYVVSELNFLTTDKIKSLVVQGENPRGFFRPTGEAVNPIQNNTNAYFFRTRINPVTGLQFSDMVVYGHGIASLAAQYQITNVPAAKYKVYWVAVNDTLQVNGTKNPVLFSQKLAMGTMTSATFPYVPVPLNNYNEVYLGEYTHTAFGNLNMFLTANTNTTAGTSNLSLDYIRLEPQF